MLLPFLLSAYNIYNKNRPKKNSMTFSAAQIEKPSLLGEIC